MKKYLAVIGLLAFFSMLMVSCDLFESDPSDEETREEEIKTDFKQFDSGTRFTGNGTLGNLGEKKVVYGTVGIGTREIKGKKWDHVKLGYDMKYNSELGRKEKLEDEGIKGIELWGKGDPETGYELIALKDNNFIPAILGTADNPENPMEIILDEPFTIETSDGAIQVGEKQYINASAKLNNGHNVNDIPGSVDGYYEVKAQGVSVTVDNGAIYEDCTQVGINATISSEYFEKDLGIKDVPISGDIYVHEVLGPVKVDLDMPAGLPGVSVSMDDQVSWGDAEVGWNVIQKVGVVTNGKPFSLSTYDRRGKLDADKNKHAKMLVEVRWANEEKAKTGDMPSGIWFDLEFGTQTGYFGHQLIESPFSIFHPEENGKGYKYWYAFVDQADKYEEIQGIEYHIDCEWQAETSPIRVTARIGYEIIAE